MENSVTIESKDKKNKISLAQWTKYLKQASDFTMVDFLSISNPITGNIIKIEAPNCGIWKPNSNYEVPFSFNEEKGHISVNRPDAFVLEKIMNVSKDLNGKVLGEDGQQYYSS